MKAIEAQNISKEVQTGLLSAIHAQIENAAKRGQFSTTVHVPLMQSLRQALEDDGYTIQPVFKNQDYNNQTLISWWTTRTT